MGGDSSHPHHRLRRQLRGTRGAQYGPDLKTPRGTTYLVTAPGDPGLARAYISGDLELVGAHPGDPYPALKALASDLKFSKPSPLQLATRRARWASNISPIAPPPQAEAVPRWRRFAEGLRHSKPVMPRPSRTTTTYPTPSTMGARAVDDLHLRGVPGPGCSR